MEVRRHRLRRNRITRRSHRIRNVETTHLVTIQIHHNTSIVLHTQIHHRILRDVSQIHMMTQVTRLRLRQTQRIHSVPSHVIEQLLLPSTHLRLTHSPRSANRRQRREHHREVLTRDGTTRQIQLSLSHRDRIIARRGGRSLRRRHLKGVETTQKTNVSRLKVSSVVNRELLHRSSIARHSHTRSNIAGNRDSNDNASSTLTGNDGARGSNHFTRVNTDRTDDQLRLLISGKRSSNLTAHTINHQSAHLAHQSKGSVTHRTRRIHRNITHLTDIDIRVRQSSSRSRDGSQLKIHSSHEPRRHGRQIRQTVSRTRNRRRNQNLHLVHSTLRLHVLHINQSLPRTIILSSLNLHTRRISIVLRLEVKNHTTDRLEVVVQLNQHIVRILTTHNHSRTNRRDLRIRRSQSSQTYSVTQHTTLIITNLTHHSIERRNRRRRIHQHYSHHIRSQTEHSRRKRDRTLHQTLIAVRRNRSSRHLSIHSITEHFVSIHQNHTTMLVTNHQLHVTNTLQHNALLVHLN